MKRPLSVIATLILFGLIVIILAILFYFKTPNIWGYIALVVLGIAWVGVLIRKKWGLWLSLFLIMLMGGAAILWSFTADTDELIDYISLIFVLASELIPITWWAYSLGLGKASKEYFLRAKIATKA